MNALAKHRIERSELLSALEQVLGVRVVSLRRRFCPYSSSYTIEQLDVTVAGGKRLRLIVKDMSTSARHAEAKRVRPEFLYSPAREIEVYRKMLSPAWQGTAHCFGAVVSPKAGRHWLFLERVDGPLLWQVGDLAKWEAAARWLAAFHARFHGRKLPGSKRLHDYDEEFFAIWINRAEEFLKKRRVTGLKNFSKLAKRYHKVIDRLSVLPRSLIHGEFYPSNILVREASETHRICPVDWEMAGVGPSALDLAALTAGEWREADMLRFIGAYREELPRRLALSQAELLEAVQACQLHLSVQMLGWAEDWTPPEQHAKNWLNTALRLADKLGIT